MMSFETFVFDINDEILNGFYDRIKCGHVSTRIKEVYCLIKTWKKEFQEKN